MTTTRPLKLAEKTLERMGYRAICRSDVRSGLAAAEKEAPGAVILDLIMPGLDGFEFLKRFRAMPAGRNTPVIVWTVQDLIGKERAILQASAQAVVSKAEGSAALIRELRFCVPPPISAGPGKDPSGR
jgi:CheY-like chemotaxis protein